MLSPLTHLYQLFHLHAHYTPDVRWLFDPPDPQKHEDPPILNVPPGYSPDFPDSPVKLSLVPPAPDADRFFQELPEMHDQTPPPATENIQSPYHTEPTTGRFGIQKMIPV